MKPNRYVLLTLVLLFAGCLPAAAKTLVIPGTGACQNLLRGLAGAYVSQHLDHEIIIPDSIGSGGGILTVIDGRSVIARVARPLTKMESGKGVKYMPFAKDAMVFATGSNIRVRSLTVNQLKEVFSGRISHWHELGGEHAIIRLLIREKGDSSYGMIDKHIRDFSNFKFSPKAKIVHHDYEMAALLKKFKNSIGWLPKSAVAQPEDKIKPIAIDHVAPTKSNINSGDYKATGEFGLVFKKEPVGLAKDFINFIFSARGDRVLKQYGVIPVDRINP